MTLHELFRNPTADGLEQLLKRLGNGESLAALMGYPKVMLEALYTHAYNCYTQANYAEAMRAFGLLMTYNHMDRRFHMGFAACLQVQKKYDEAIKYYGTATLLDPSEPSPVLHSVECFLALKKFDEATNALVRLGSMLKGNQRFAPLLRSIDATLARINDPSDVQSEPKGK
ncbi:MAG TPA: SycD/LcrH family type III secretion system chaperone [Burkholderiaceae bacterium]|jgi:type III secretion system low calcium response chaperone LcrH/SycD|nr:SycD/LcrH family type III secretion system chaperone [Burkholderiaceae bacterium]